MPYGWELIVDLHDCDQSTFTEKSVRDFCVQLCDLVKMQREDFHLWASDESERDSAPPHLYGTSAVQFITTSSIVIHALPKLRAAYVNLFSCKPFDHNAAEAFIVEYFAGSIAHRAFLERR